jgi:(S)-2-hydroxy-acid oxidase
MGLRSMCMQVDVSKVDTTLALPTFGIPLLSMPIMLAPVAMQRLAHDDGEIAAARACAAKETIYCEGRLVSCTRLYFPAFCFC